MLRADDLAQASGSTLAGLLAGGHPVAIDEVTGWLYRGVSLGLPRWMERLSWKTFAKVIVADERGAHGWNLRVEQRGVHAATVAQRRGGREWRFGPFRVVGEERRLVLDYGASAPALSPLGLLRDPIVALNPGDPRLLLGRSLIAARGRLWPTPSYFTLERERPA